MTYPEFLFTDNAKSRFRAVLILGLSLTFPVSGIVSAEPKVVDEIVEKALSATPDIDRGMKLYHNCALCHTPEGWGSPSGSYPQIAGQHQSVIIKQLADIQKNNRDNPTMMPFTKPLFAKGPQALADISAYIEQLLMVPNNNVGTGLRLEKGKEIYVEYCKKCHGENGEGDARQFYPRVQGQHFHYLLRQLQWIKMGKRRNADKEMVEQFEIFSQSDLAAVADYISRLAPDKELIADHSDWRNPDFGAGFRSVPRAR